MDMNSIVVSGRLTKDPELTKLQSGTEKANFRVAVGGLGDKTDFFPVVAWGKTAAAVYQHLKKGDRVIVQGRLTTREFDGNDGTKKTVTEINANDVCFLSMSKGENATPTMPKAEKYKQEKMAGMPPVDPMNEDDLPF